MSEPGWYPDPEGARDRIRYWDGNQWATGTAESGELRSRRRRRRVALLITALAVAAVIMTAVIIVLRPDRGGAVGDPAPAGTAPQTGPSGPAPSAAGSPTTSGLPSPSSSAGPPSPSPTRPAKRPSASCPAGAPTQTTQHTEDGRVHGGELSFPPVRGAGFGKPQVTDVFGWWYDAQEQVATVRADAATWPSRVAVGAVAIRPGVSTPDQAARSSMLCMISSPAYAGYTDHRELANRKITVDGQAGWELITEVRVQGEAVAGDRITVVAVDAGAPGSLSIFAGSAPIGDRARTKIISDTVRGLTVGR